MKIEIITTPNSELKETGFGRNDVKATLKPLKHIKPKENYA